jgi:glycosyltransferase involved in cell wall biosynthesis
LKLTAIIPVYNGGKDFSICLSALRRSTRQPDEIIVVDDGSQDNSARIARQFGACVLKTEQPSSGPAAARNLGALAAAGDILVFIDGDVAVHEDTFEKIEQVFSANPGISAVFGSYDAHPPHRSLVSLYKNLQHHYVHQTSLQEAATFWSGCGAVIRSVFLAHGGFNSLYTRPSIEDIDFGIRLSQGGHKIWLCKDVQVTHLKRWTISSWLRSDILDRAVPWSRLIFSSSSLPDDLNLSFKNRFSALLAWAVIFFGFAGLLFLPAFWGVGAALGGLVYLNAPLYRFFFQQGGAWFTAGGVFLHFCYFLYSSAVFAFVGLEFWVGRRAANLPTGVDVKTPSP